jgi:transcriptional regulator with GAF, ATPase, and Fis domain
VSNDEGPTATLATAATAAAEAAIKRFRLHVLAAPEATADFTSAGARVVIGTHESANFVLLDRTASRFHCEVSIEEHGVFIRDLGSKNGTRVDGVPVIHAPLRDGCTVKIGSTELRFESGAADKASIPLSKNTKFGLMVGRSVPMRAAFYRLEMAAARRSTVLIEGETGTGKELAAESLHLESANRDGPFVTVDCTAIPAELLESELFGHQKGAFTGAVATRQGAFEAAAGGTLFLDEIGELDANLQPKLLRVLERKQIKRVGASAYQPVDVRVIAATNRDLRAEVNAQRFRPDLYYRLAVVDVRLPPLRERKEDIPAIVEYLVDQLDPNREASLVRTDGFLAEVMRHEWQGNVRELRNYIERCIALGTQMPLGSEPELVGGDLVDAGKPLRLAKERWNNACEKQYLIEVLRRTDGNRTAAARAAGIDRNHFHRLMRQFGIK